MLTGALSDALHPAFGIESLRHAMFLSCAAALLSMWLLWRGVSREVA